jgi:hypothetical protein
VTYGVSALVLLGDASSSVSSAQAATPPPCAPRGVQLLAASQTTAVFRRREKVIACGPGTSARTLVTETRGRRADAVAVRGDRIAIAGRLSSADAFGGQSVFNLTRVVSMSGGSSLEQQNWGTVRSVRLTPAGNAVGLERHGRRVALFAALAQGRVLLDVRASITGVRVRGERVAWSTNGRRRSHDIALPVASISLPGPIPSGHEPLSGSFVAPVTGRYSIVASPVPDLGRSESCPYASTGVLRASGGQPMSFELRPALAAWCQTKGLKVTLTLEYGRDAGPNGPLPRCAERPTPCGGELDVGQTLLAANASAPLGAAQLTRVDGPSRAAGRN